MAITDGVAMAGRRLAFSHFGVSCFDIAKMEDFYTRVLGMTVSDRGYVEEADLHLVFMTSDPREHHQFVLASRRKEGAVHSGPVVGGSIGTAIFQASFRAADLEVLRVIKRRLEEEGVADIVTMSHGNAWALYARDPEGNALEFFVDSPWFVHQPCGVPLDLERSDEDILEETEAYCRTQPDFSTYGEWREEAYRRILADQEKALG